MVVVIEEKKEEKPFSFEIPLNSAPVEPVITSADIEKKVAEQTAPIEPKKRGRKPGSTNKKQAEEIPENVKKLFGPLVVGAHNGICILLKLSRLDKDQSEIVSNAWSELLHKRAPEFLEKHGDWVAAAGASALVFGTKLATETKFLNFLNKADKETKDNGKTEQHNNNTGKEGKREDGTI